MPANDVSRRDFIKQGGVAATSLLLAAGVLPALQAHAEEKPAKHASAGVLKGFVVADAHFGWVNPQIDNKEHPELSHAAVRQILKRFPDLDLFVDVGDAFHNGAPDYALEQWTECVANEVGPIPFFYSVGNHELGLVPDVDDIEQRANILGSVMCRPYYSFDLKGIHFVAVPELILATIVSQETLEWLDLDLELNRDRTTILFSHNSIKGTTLPQDDLGYRRLINSEQIFERLRRYPNVIAWMHGHQHTFEMVPMAGKVFISCGRIGGFDPQYMWEPKAHQGKGHMGGIYFEVSPEGAHFRAYSSTQNKFFDELPEHGHLTQHIKDATSFDPVAPAALAYGAGNALDGQRFVVHNHVVSASGRQDLHVGGAAGAVLNENADLRGWCQRTLPDCQSKHIPGFYIQPGWGNVQYADESWQPDPAGGFRIYPYAHMGEERWIEAPGERESQRSYYRCVPGQRYQVRARVDCERIGQRALFKVHLSNNRLKELSVNQSATWTLRAGPNDLQFEFLVPEELAAGTLYADPASDVMLQMNVELRLPDLRQEVVLRSFEIRSSGATDLTENAGVQTGDREFQQHGALDAGGWVDHAWHVVQPARSIVETRAGGSGRLTWRLRQCDLRWQVRNATVTSMGQTFEVGPLRSRYSKAGDIIIAPLAPVHGAYVSRLRNIAKARITPGEGSTIKIEVCAINAPQAEIELRTPSQPRRVHGASWTYADGKLMIKLEKAGLITIDA